MKTLKLKPWLKDDLLQGKKTKTWKMFDEKNLSLGDAVQFVDSETDKPIARAVITEVVEKKFGEIGDADFDGHNPYPSREVMLTTYRGYYGEKVGWDTTIKMLTFELNKEV